MALKEPENETAPEQTADLLRRSVMRTARRMRHEAGGPLTPTQTAVLATIWRKKVTTAGALAEAEGVRRPTMTRVLAHLDEAGMIERRTDPDDGRCQLITASSEGTAYLEGQRSRRSAWLARVLADLEPGEIETLRRAANILDRALTGEPA